MKTSQKLIIFIDRKKIKSGLVTLGAEPKVEKTKEFDWSEETLAEVFKKIKNQYKIDKAGIVLGNDLCFLTELSIPKDVTNERSFIGLKASEKFPVVLENKNWDFKTIGETKTQKQISIFALPKELSEKVKLAADTSGLIVENIEPSAVSERNNSDPMIGLAIKSDIMSKDKKEELLKTTVKKEIMEEEKQEIKVEEPTAHVKEKQPGKSKAFLIIFVIIILVGGLTAGGIILSQKSLKGISSEKPPSPAAAVTTTTAPISSPTQTATPSATISKKDLKISVLNGSGIAGLAGKAKTFLESLGYKVASTGNAEVFTYETTEVSIKEDKKAFLSELLKSLGGKYILSGTNPLLDSKSEFDIVIKLGKK